MKKRLLTFAIGFCVVLVLASCGASKPVADTALGEAVSFDRHQVWQLVALKGKPVSGPATTLILNSEAGALNGRSACNRYFADFTQKLVEQTAQGTRYALKISYLGVGETRCPDADMEAEARYLALLPKADACLLTEYTLTLYKGNKEILKFELQ